MEKAAEYFEKAADLGFELAQVIASEIYSLDLRRSLDIQALECII